MEELLLQTEMHTADTFPPDPYPFQEEIAIKKLERYKSPDTDQIPAELIQAGGDTLCSEIHKLINSIWSKSRSGRGGEEKNSKPCREWGRQDMFTTYSSEKPKGRENFKDQGVDGTIILNWILKK